MGQDVSYMGTGVYSKQANLTQTTSVSDSSMSIDVTVDLTPSQTTTTSNAISLDPDTYQRGYGFEEEHEEVLDEDFDFNRLENNVKAESRGVTPNEEDQEAEDRTGYLGQESTTYDDGDYFALGEDYFEKVQVLVKEEPDEVIEGPVAYKAPEEAEDVKSPAAVEDDQEYDGLETEIEILEVEEPDIPDEADSQEETPKVTLEMLIRTGILLI